MGFWDKENSAAEGQPNELYDFCISSDHWYHTNSPQEIVYNFCSFQPETISHTNIIRCTSFVELVRNSFQVTLPQDNTFVDRFSLIPVDNDVTMTLYQGHSETDFEKVYVGYVIGISFTNEWATLTVASRLSRLARASATVRFQKLCPLALYGHRCGAYAPDFTVVGTLTYVSSTTLKSNAFAAKADGWFTNGWLECNGFSRWILSHTGDTVTIATAIPDAAIGMPFSAKAGCKRNMNVCHNKFNRKLNYGGHRFLPTKNPLSGSSIV